MLGRLGNRGCPRLGDTAWAATVTPAKITTGTATESTKPRNPRISAGGRIRPMPVRPSRTSRRLLSTTTRLENPMATAATSGSRSPAAARGKAERLYPMAQPKFCTMTAEVEPAIPTAAGTPSRSLPSRATSLLAIADSEPLPTAHPTSAAARAGASLTPSPTIITR